MIQNFIAIDAVSILALLLLEFMVFQSEILNEKKRRIFCVGINAVILTVLSQIGTTLFDNSRPEYRLLSIVFNTVAFSICPFIPIIISDVFSTPNENRRISILKNIPGAVNATFTISSPFNGSIFSVSEDNVYSRGPLFEIFVSAYVIGIVFLIGRAWMIERKYRINTKTIYCALALFLSLCSSIQVFYPNIHVAWICVTIALISFYALLCDQNDCFDIQTSLFNRRIFEREINRLRPNAKGTIILCDVDDFKFVNDNYGHVFGDLCLSILAQAVLEQFDDKGYCFRFGGDEFCVLCTTDDEKEISRLLHNVVHSIEECRRKDKRIPRISFGYQSFIVGPDFEINSVIREADRRMYQYKHKNKKLIKIKET